MKATTSLVSERRELKASHLDNQATRSTRKDLGDKDLSDDHNDDCISNLIA
jgi:hypothetical protein